VSRSLVIGQYYPSDSFIHRIDPRVKIAVTAGYALTVLTIGNFAGLIAVALFITTLFAIIKAPVWIIIKGLRPLLFIMLVTFVFQLFTGGGPWINIWFVRVSEPGFHIGVFVIARLLLLVTGASVLTLTTTPVELSHAIERLIFPLGKIGVPAQEIGMMVMIALRFIPTLSDETDKIIKAQTARGARFDAGGLFARVRSVIPVLIPLFVSIFRRSDELAEAMDARAYRGGAIRTRMKELVLKPSDIVILILWLAILVLIVWIGRLPVW
jgi:energy-coupling factor transport system permease protein